MGYRERRRVVSSPFSSSHCFIGHALSSIQLLRISAPSGREDDPGRSSETVSTPLTGLVRHVIVSDINERGAMPLPSTDRTARLVAEARGALADQRRVLGLPQQDDTGKTAVQIQRECVVNLLVAAQWCEYNDWRRAHRWTWRWRTYPNPVPASPMPGFMR